MNPQEHTEAAVRLRWVSGEEGIAQALRVRFEVFCEEQGVPLSEEIDGRDGEAEHLLASEDSGRVIATLRLLADAGGTAKIGRVAVEVPWRRRGVASAMLEAAIERASASGARRARLAAQTAAVALYEAAGFAIESEEFEEAGIPHVWMGRDL